MPVTTRSAQPTPKSLPLLHLPPELRNLIYTYVLIDPSSTTRIQLRDLHPPPLLSTSHQIRIEAAPIYFAHNPFVLTVCLSPKVPNREAPDTLRVHRVPIPPWIRSLPAPLHMRNVKVEIDYAFRWVVVTMAQKDGPMRVVEAWLHNGRQQLPVLGMGEKIQRFLDETLARKTDVEEEQAGLDFRDVVRVAGRMCGQWARRIVPG